MTREYEKDHQVLGKNEIVLKYKRVMLLGGANNIVWLDANEALLALDWLNAHKDELAQFAASNTRQEEKTTQKEQQEPVNPVP